MLGESLLLHVFVLFVFVCVLYSLIVSWECGGMLIQGYVC